MYSVVILFTKLPYITVIYVHRRESYDGIKSHVENAYFSFCENVYANTLNV